LSPAWANSETLISTNKNPVLWYVPVIPAMQET
jgi:hypothetical protein